MGHWRLLQAALLVWILVAASPVVCSVSRVVLSKRAHIHENVPISFQHVGRAQAEDAVHFAVQLKHRNLDKLEEIFHNVSNPKHSSYGKHLTQQEVIDLVSPDPSVAQNVIDWIRNHVQDNNQARVAPGLIVDYKDHIRVTGISASLAESLFETELHHYEKNGHRQAIHVGPLSIPQHLAEHVDLVTGITMLYPVEKVGGASRKQKQQQKVHQESGQAAADAVKPAIAAYDGLTPDSLILPSTIRELYKIPSDATAMHPNNSQCIVAFAGDYFSSGALYEYLSMSGTPVPAITTAGGISCYLNYNNCSGQGESNLDMQYITTIARNSPTWFWSGSYHDAGLEWAQNVLNTPNAPLVFSISYGLGEPFTGRGGYDSEQYLMRTNTYFAMIGATGRTILAASGDNGAVDNQNGISDAPIGSDQVCEVHGCADIPANFVDPATNLISCDCTQIQMTVTYSDRSLSPRYAYLPLLDPFSSNFISILQTRYGVSLSQTTWSTMLAKFADFNGQYVWLGDDAAQNFQFCSTLACPMLTSVRLSNYNMYMNPSIKVNITLSGRTRLTADIPFLPGFPATSPYVTAVGGTQLSQTPNLLCAKAALQSGFSSCLGEVASSVINSPPGQITTGGGFSLLFDQPLYQQAAVAKYVAESQAMGNFPPAGYQNTSKRAFPDISALAANYFVSSSIAETDSCPCELGIFGGTSASCPVMAGMITLINDKLLQQGRPPLGFINPLLYQMAAERPSTFTDVVAGDNRCTTKYCLQYGYYAAQAWDATTGLGTLNFGEAVDYILNDIPRLQASTAASTSAISAIWSKISNYDSLATSYSVSTMWIFVGLLLGMTTFSFGWQVYSSVSKTHNVERIPAKPVKLEMENVATPTFNTYMPMGEIAVDDSL